jgi:hypothetical protein
MGPPARLIDEKKPDDAVRETIRREMTEAFAVYAGVKEMRLPSTVFLVTDAPPALIAGGRAATFCERRTVGIRERFLKP